jgi:hypothetical protein
MDITQRRQATRQKTAQRRRAMRQKPGSTMAQ